MARFTSWAGRIRRRLASPFRRKKAPAKPPPVMQAAVQPALPTVPKPSAPPSQTPQRQQIGKKNRRRIERGIRRHEKRAKGRGKYPPQPEQKKTPGTEPVTVENLVPVPGETSPASGRSPRKTLMQEHEAPPDIRARWSVVERIRGGDYRALDLLCYGRIISFDTAVRLVMVAEGITKDEATEIVRGKMKM